MVDTRIARERMVLLKHNDPLDYFCLVGCDYGIDERYAHNWIDSEEPLLLSSNSITSHLQSFERPLGCLASHRNSYVLERYFYVQHHYLNILYYLEDFVVDDLIEASMLPPYHHYRQTLFGF